MEPRRFDSLARSLAAPKTRRGLLGSLAALGVGLLGARAAGAAVPACRGAGHPCEGNQRCCDGLTCVAGGPGDARRCTAPAPTTTTSTTTAAPECAMDAHCPVNETCVEGRCRCGAFLSSVAPSTCCPGGDIAVCQLPGVGFFLPPATCSAVESCPPGDTPCPGTDCAACCPPGTTCDPRGYCRQ